MGHSASNRDKLVTTPLDADHAAMGAGTTVAPTKPEGAVGEFLGGDHVTQVGVQLGQRCARLRLPSTAAALLCAGHGAANLVDGGGETPVMLEQLIESVQALVAAALLRHFKPASDGVRGIVVGDAHEGVVEDWPLRQVGRGTRARVVTLDEPGIG